MWSFGDPLPEVWLWLNRPLFLDSSINGDFTQENRQQQQSKHCGKFQCCGRGDIFRTRSHDLFYFHAYSPQEKRFICSGKSRTTFAQTLYVELRYFVSSRHQTDENYAD